MTTPLSKEEALAALIRIIRGIQEISGRNCPKDLTSDLHPIGDLEGFDSLNGVEATVLLEEELHCSLGKDNLFVSEDEARALRISEIADLVCRLKQGKAA